MIALTLLGCNMSIIFFHSSQKDCMLDFNLLVHLICTLPLLVTIEGAFLNPFGPMFEQDL